jgi:hypothetical protein
LGEGLERIRTPSLGCQGQLCGRHHVHAIGASPLILAPQIMQSLMFGPAYSQAVGEVFQTLFSSPPCSSCRFPPP